MRFEKLLLERYGAFTDRALELRPQARLHVVLGANEAGKTSALNAIGDFLFGFGHTTNYDFLHDKAALRIGARLRLLDGSQISLRRRKGAKNTILDENDKPLATDPLAPLLGSVTRDVFFSEFGLTSEALRAGGRELLRAGGRLAETLAASSAQLSALAQLRARLLGEADALFGPRQSAGKAFYLAHDEYKKSKERFRDAIVTADALSASRRAVDDAKKKRDALDAEHERIGRELSRLRRSQRTRPKLSRIDALSEELAGLADLPEVESATLGEWREARESSARIEAELAQLHEEELIAAMEIGALEVDERLLEAGARIEELRQDVGAVLRQEIDLPKRIAEARGAREELRNAARDLGRPDENELLRRQPTAPQLALVRELIGKRVAAERALTQAQAARDDARRELEELEERAARLGAASDPAPLARRLEAFADVPAEADRLRRELSALSNERRALDEETHRLDPRAGAPEELARLVLPDALEIEAARRLLEQLEEEEKQAATRARDLAAALQRLDEEIAQASRDGAVATREELNDARRRRGEVYDRLGDALDGDPAERRAAFVSLGEENKAVDATADILLADANRSARFESARERRARELRESEKAKAALVELAKQKEHASEVWSQLWARSGVKPKNPQSMARWLERVDELLHRRDNIEQRALDAVALKRKLDEYANGLRRLLQDMDTAEDHSSPIDALHKHARATLDRLREKWGETHAGVALRDKGRKTLAKAEQDLAKAAEETARLREAWPGALAAIGLGGEATPAQAEAALAIWQSVPAPRGKLEDLTHRIGAMEQEIDAFETKSAALLEHVAPDLRDRPRRDALDILNGKLTEARRARDRRDALREAARRREDKRVALARKHAVARVAIEQARAVLVLDDASLLTPAFERLEKRAALRNERDRAVRDLLESADGLDEATLRDEQADIDFDMLAGAVERLTVEGKQTLDELQQAAAALHEAGKAHETLSAGRDAAGAAHDKAEAGARLAEVASRWLARAAAARLATLAIERHRAAVQDPLLKRASELFCLATGGAFASLGADFDENDAPSLVGQRHNGARVPVAGMSEGARDQLFLALRLALLELRAAEPLPFVGDDLLASFDDARTACALRLLAEFGRERQAIVFTHHRHVAEIARGLSDADVDVIEL